jgi:hypothetical protein
MATSTSIIETAEAAGYQIASAEQLSFTSRREDENLDLWSPADSHADWLAQCRAGRSYGHELVEYVRETNDAALLQGIVQRMAERRTFGGIEAGFFAAVSMALAA